MSPRAIFDRYFEMCPVVAIIRGVTPADAASTGRALFEGGIRTVEVPLNSPQPFDSIRAIVDELGDEALVGAGTVLDPADVGRVRDAGGRIVVSPNTDPAVIAATIEAGMVSCPGFFTPTEAFKAIDSGAHALKLFPAEAASPAVVKAQRAVLPRDIPLIVVGGVTAGSVRDWLQAGADGFGLGSALYRPGQPADETREKAQAFAAAVRR